MKDIDNSLFVYMFVKIAGNFSGIHDGEESKYKSLILHKSSIEEILLNFAVSQHYSRTLVELNLR